MTVKPTDSGWFGLPCGAELLVELGVGKAVRINMSNALFPFGALPPTDEIVLKEAHELLGYRVEVVTAWTTDQDQIVKVAGLRKKITMDDPEQIF